MADLLTYEEAARLLRRAPATLRKDVMLRRVPYVKLFGAKGAVRFEREALERLIEASRVEPSAIGKSGTSKAAVPAAAPGRRRASAGG